MKRKKIKVVEKKLGREKALGLAYIGENYIEIDSRLKSKKFVEVCLHEVCHVYFPEASESKVNRFGMEAAQILWKFGIRRIRK